MGAKTGTAEEGTTPTAGSPPTTTTSPSPRWSRAAARASTRPDTSSGTC
ncbi:hypothetical protein ACFQZC_16115 [Streptacidiphilus monticola]